MANYIQPHLKISRISSIIDIDDLSRKGIITYWSWVRTFLFFSSNTNNTKKTWKVEGSKTTDAFGLGKYCLTSLKKSISSAKFWVLFPLVSSG